MNSVNCRCEVPSSKPAINLHAIDTASEVLRRVGRDLRSDEVARREAQRRADDEAQEALSPYVRYHEIGNLSEKSKSCMVEVDHDVHQEHINDVVALIKNGTISIADASHYLSSPEKPKPTDVWEGLDSLLRDAVRAFAISPAKLGIPEKPTPSPRSYNYAPNYHGCDETGKARPYGVTMSTMQFAQACRCLICKEYLTSKENTAMAQSPIGYNVYLSHSPISPDSSSPVSDQHILAELEARAKDDPEFAQRIKRSAERAENAYKRRVEQALEGAAELELLKGAPNVDFVIKHFYEDTEYTVYGTAYPGYDDDEEMTRKRGGITVLIHADAHPLLCSRYGCMETARKVLERPGSAYVIKYFE